MDTSQLANNSVSGNAADSRSSSTVAEKLVQLSRAFDRRTKAVKAEFVRNGEGYHSSMLPSGTDYSDDEQEKPKMDHLQPVRTSATKSPTLQQEGPTPFQQIQPETRLEGEACNLNRSNLWNAFKNGAIDTSTTVYRIWLAVLSLAFLYNFWSISLRASFPMYQTQQDNKLLGWMIMDYICDLVVLSDIIFVKPRLTFYDKGLIVYDRKVLRKTYLTSTKFKLDIISLLPLDLCYLAVGYVQPLFRLPRLLNARTFLEMFDRFDRSSSIPEVFRMLKTVIYVLMTVHLYTCVYYLFSERIGIGHDHFVFEGDPWPAYSRCFFVTFKMATRIGGQQKEPHTNPERGLMAAFWLIALCVEIVLLAQVREIFLSVTKEDDEFRLLLSAALSYVRRYKCPVEIEKKVRDWFTYTRETQRTLDEEDILKLLPKHLRTDLAFDIHYSLLSKVSIFENCERSVIADVVVKLKVEMFFPNDVIYRKGDVGKKMYIIEKGQAEVLDENGVLAATLTEGAVFGERSLLALGSNNRRHVTVQSKGFSNLFVLAKEDFEEIMAHHPKLLRRIRKKASVYDVTVSSANIFKTNSDLAQAQPIVNTTEKPKRPTTPKLLGLMLKLLPGRSSMIRRLLKIHPAATDNDDNTMMSTITSDYDAELAALQWSSPSPDNFYIQEEWEMRHYRMAAARHRNQVREAFVEASDEAVTTKPAKGRRKSILKKPKAKEQNISQGDHPHSAQSTDADEEDDTALQSNQVDHKNEEGVKKDVHFVPDNSAVKVQASINAPSTVLTNRSFSAMT